jgi:subtilisin family serine protease
MRTRWLLMSGVLLLAAACTDAPEPLAPEPDPLESASPAAAEQVRVLVELVSSADQGLVAAQAQAQGGRVLRQFSMFPLMSLEVNANALGGLMRSPRVVSVTPIVPEPPLLGTSLGVINAPQVHDLGLDGSGFAVAILDTGIDAAHPFVAGRVVEEACFSSDGTDQTALCGDGSTDQTGSGSASINVTPCTNAAGNNICDHGMHVAGIAAGDGDAQGAPGPGVAPGADIIAIQVFTRFDDNVQTNCANNNRPSPCVLSFVDDQIAALEYIALTLAAPYDIASVNMSLGGGQNFTTCDTDDRTAWVNALRALNIATVVASGNRGFDNAINQPACISTAVAVGATNNFDGVAGFSNRGPLLDLFAPGVDIRSSVDDDGFGFKQGTSMAAPHVAGAWAVIRQAFPTMSVGDVLDLLTTTGVPIDYFSTGTGFITTPRLDLYAAFRPALTVDADPVTVAEGDLATNSGTFSDPNDDPVTLSASVGAVVDNGDGTWSWSFLTEDGPEESQTVTITGTDPLGAEGSVDFTLVVNNVPPTVEIDPTIATSTVSNDPFELRFDFSDPGIIDYPWSYTIDWGDGTEPKGGSTNDQSETITAFHTFCAAGSRTITVTVTDKDGDSGQDTWDVEVGFFAVDIAIQPDEEPNSVSLTRGGLLPVVVYGAADFDATQVDPATVFLGDGADAGTNTPVDQRPNGTFRASVEDVNGNGILDLILHFRIPDLVENGALTEDSEMLVLTGFLEDGCTNFQGADSVRPVP